MKLTRRQKVLFQFVYHSHGDQKRKYTRESYWTHPLAVAEMVASIEIDDAIEVCMLHDIIEDTDMGPTDIHVILKLIGYSDESRWRIVDSVIELTNVYTSESFPMLSRSERKSLEAIRLGEISPLAASVKYCDLMHNTASIVEHDPKFAKVYIAEKEAIMKVMTNGNPELYKMCMETLERAKKELNG